MGQISGTTILNRVNPIGKGPGDDGFVWEDSTGHVLPLQRIWETQRYLLADALTDFRVIRDTREGVVVGRKWNVRPDPAVVADHMLY